MSRVFNVVEADNFFLGEDKFLRLPVYGPDGVTPIDVATWALDYVIRKTNKAADPAIIHKSKSSGSITVEGVFNVDPSVNTQQVVIPFFRLDTVDLKPAEYHHSLERVDVGNYGILYFGTIVLRQAPSH